MIKREDAWQVLTEFTKDKSLLKHALAVEAGMRAYARKFGEDEELWGVVGLIHDFDYERFPTIPEHTAEGAKILRSRGWPEEIILAAVSHASYSGVPRDSRMAKALFAVDELTGLIMAAALVRPTKDIRDITEIKSIKSKFKDKAFAAGVNRQEVIEGAEALGVALWEEHVPLVLEAMKGIAAELELDGRLANPAGERVTGQ
ncbi:MAG TPA: HDIG domain-containing protein [Anaerolineae bacterium]|nr:HDIG domain-containing protein [Anaerolineae bacterium]HNT05863.1 HDIG domain-containing protein [Anaerolineae bacterium]HOU23094.1 HDIG domain-containing protein [Anaerolineae bacterium]HQJ50261.1 HDIG domain-containing protein [Anaerolineae bacterium]